MAKRLQPLSQQDYDAAVADLEAMAAQAVKIANTIGRAFGAKLCDKGLGLNKSILALKRQIDDQFFYQNHGPQQSTKQKVQPWHATF